MPAEPTLLRVLITRRHWQRFETFDAQFKRAARAVAEQQGEESLAKVTVSPRQFERWYAGKVKTIPHPDSCRVLEYMFSRPVDQLLAPASQANASAPETLGPGELAQIAEHDEIQHSAMGPSAIWSPSAESARGDGLWGLTDSADYSVIPDPERIIAMAARRALRFGAAADASNVGSESLEQLRGETSRLAVAYLQHPLPDIIGDIVALQDHTFTLLEGRQRPREARDLYVIGGLASGMLAKAAHDLRDPHLAMTHARTALLCARNAEHVALSAWVHGMQSLITYWSDRPREALQYAQAGQEIHGLTGSSSVWLASLEARAWSALGNGTASHLAIERAAALREQAVPDDLDELGGMCYFSRPRELYYAADSGAFLREPGADQDKVNARIAAYAAEAIAAYESAPPGEKSFSDEAGSRTDLAVARVRVHDLEGAREAIEPVLCLPVTQRIHGVVSSVINVHREITAQSADAPVGREIQEEIEEYCRTPATALPHLPPADATRGTHVPGEDSGHDRLAARVQAG
jgi:hypothetical protein